MNSIVKTLKGYMVTTAAALLLALPAKAQLVTATVTITNAPVNASTLTINSTVLTWTNGTPVGTLSSLITNTFGGDATNLYTTASAVLPFGGVQVTNTASNVVVFSGVGLSASLTTGWATLVLNTNGTTPATQIVAPIGIYDAGIRTNAISQHVLDINVNSTNGFGTNTAAMQYFVDLFNAQTLSNKVLILASIYSGVISNVTLTNCNYSGTESKLTNGTWTGAILTNGRNFGNPFSSPGTGAGSEQFGFQASAVGLVSVAFGDSAFAGSNNASAYGEGAMAYSFDSTAIGGSSVASNNLTSALGFNANASFTSSTAIGSQAVTTTNHQVMFGTSSEFVQFPGGVLFTGPETNLVTAGTNGLNGVLYSTRFVNSAIANGVNQDVSTGTNFLIQLTGASAAFSTAGFTGGINDRMIIVESGIGQQWTILNTSGLESTAANRITTLTGSDVVLTNFAFAMFKYDSSFPAWKLMFATGQPSSGGSGAFSGTFSGSISATNTAAMVTVLNPLTINTPYTNGASRSGLTINYTLTDSAISGSPSLLVTNLTSGEYQVLSNSFVLSGSQYLATSILLSPSDVMYVSNVSTGSATASIFTSTLKRQ